MSLNAFIDHYVKYGANTMKAQLYLRWAKKLKKSMENKELVLYFQILIQKAYYQASCRTSLISASTTVDHTAHS